MTVWRNNDSRRDDRGSELISSSGRDAVAEAGGELEVGDIAGGGEEVVSTGRRETEGAAAAAVMVVEVVEERMRSSRGPR